MSDVYALGVLLYELLAGRSPHQFSAAHPSPTELLRVVGEVEPVRPSLAAADPSRRRLLRGDLDNILLTALRKEPARRYPSVGAFAEDIQRHLQKRPVRARAATFGYRTGKFFSRNRAAAIAGALAILALVAGTVVSVWNAQRARSETRRAARNFEDVRQLTNSFLFEFHDAIANLPGATAARRLVVSRALEYLDKLSRQAASDPRLQMELAEAYLKIGDVQGKPYTANLGDAEGAIHSYHQAATIAAAEAANEAGTTRSDARNVLSKAYASLATVQARANQFDEATANNSRALAIGEALLADDPAHADDWRRLIVSCHLGLGDAIQGGNHVRQDPALFRGALAHYRRALPVAEQSVAALPESAIDLHHLARTCARIAAIQAELGEKSGDPADFDECFAFHERNAALYTTLVERNPENVQFRRNLADAFVATAYARVLSGRHLELGLDETTRALQIEATARRGRSGQCRSAAGPRFCALHRRARPPGAGRIFPRRRPIPKRSPHS